MQHLIVLPGNSLKNKAWGELILEHFGSKFDSSLMLSYDHWVSGEANIDFVREEEKIRQHVSALTVDTEIVVFAKSAGSLLAFLAISHSAVAPTRCVFFGIPFDLATDGIFKEDWSPVDSLVVPSIAFHNVEDPTTSYEFTKRALSEHNPSIKLITTHETDHWYGNVDLYKEDIIVHLDL